MIIEGEIVDITTDGRGVLKEGGKVTFVKNALPGDFVRAKITKEKKNFNEGIVEVFLEYSKNRRFLKNENPLGEAYPLYALFYDFGFNLKANIVKENFRKFLGLDINIVSHKNEDYRVNKLRLHKNGKFVGLNLNKSNEIYVPDMNILLGDNGEELYLDAKNNVIGGKFITIRRATNGDFLETDGEYRGKLFDGFNDRNNKTSKMPEMEVLGNKYLVGIDDFFQNNTRGAEMALEIIGNDYTGEILDLYSGVGLISLYVAKNANHVLGVEIWEPAVENAKKNAELNGIENVKFMALDTSEFAKKKLPDADTVIVDPPRSGLVPELIERIKEIKPEKIIYMSCDHTTQIRDLKSMIDMYEIENKEAHVIDMFPGTMHVECIALIQRVK